MSRQVPAVSKSYPAAKALALGFALLPVVNSKKEFLGVVLREDLEKVLYGPGEADDLVRKPTQSNPATTKSLSSGTSQLSGTKANDYFDSGSAEIEHDRGLERTVLLRRIGLVVYSEKMMELVDLALLVAKVDSTVLLSGESGVGKELLAKLIHDQSVRNLGPFIKINCGAIPENLLESELFGYEGGAFTGANKQGKMGLFELATGGTMFLDEIGEMPINLQVKVLRAIQEQEFVRVGGTTSRKVDVRFIAATNRELEEMVEQGKFRKDLYFRLNVIPICVPPLRERRDDILPLVHHFQAKFKLKFQMDKNFKPDALKALFNYSWPGNVRELENIIERLFVTVSAKLIGQEHLPHKLLSGLQVHSVKIDYVVSLRQAVDEVQEVLIRKALAESRNTYEAANALGIDQSTLMRKISKFKVSRISP